MRLPDGHPRGVGFSGTGNQSLQRFAAGEIPSLAAIDGSTRYDGWADLVTTLRAIVDYERVHSTSIKLNVAEQNLAINPNDHSDHLMTAKLALEGGQGLACARRLYYVDYASSHMPANLDPHQRDMESSVLAVTAAGILERDHASIWTNYFQSYLGRNYFRVEESRGRCEEPAADVLQAASKPQPKGAPAEH